MSADAPCRVAVDPRLGVAGGLCLDPEEGTEVPRVALTWPSPAPIAMIAAARCLQVPVVELPEDEGAARWIAATAIVWDQARVPAGERGVEALTSFARAADVHECDPSAMGVPRPDTLVARWARRAWVACRGCGGGGVRRGPCARCGAPVGDPS